MPWKSAENYRTWAFPLFSFTFGWRKCIRAFWPHSKGKIRQVWELGILSAFLNVALSPIDGNGQSRKIGNTEGRLSFLRFTICPILWTVSATNEFCKIFSIGNNKQSMLSKASVFSCLTKNTDIPRILWKCRWLLDAF